MSSLINNTLTILLILSPQQWECLLLSCPHSLQVAPALVSQCHRLGSAKDLHEISAVLHLQVIRDLRQGYQAECIQIG